MGMSFQHLVAIGAGGALGAVGRYGVMVAVGHWVGHGFPYATLIVNLAGAFLLGAFIELSALAWSPSPEMRSFIVVGVLGAFTTFSTFSLDIHLLWMRGETLAAFGYALISVVLCVVGLFAGLALMRVILS